MSIKSASFVGAVAEDCIIFTVEIAKPSLKAARFNTKIKPKRSCCVYDEASTFTAYKPVDTVWMCHAIWMTDRQTDTHTFNSLFSRTTWVGQHEKG